MAEYIEREALLHEMKMDIRPPFAVVRDFPAADLVEVVRCKDCKWHDSVDGPMRQCDITDDDDFCSYGEREDKQNET